MVDQVYSKVPLSKRSWDWIFILFLVVDCVIGLIVDLEVLLVPDPLRYNPAKQPFPPKIVVEFLHDYGRSTDPLLLSRPIWYRVAITFKLLAIPLEGFMAYGFITGDEWLQIPGIIFGSIYAYSTVLTVAENLWGKHVSPKPEIVLAANIPYILFGLFLVLRLLDSRPFHRVVVPKKRN